MGASAAAPEAAASVAAYPQAQAAAAAEAARRAAADSSRAMMVCTGGSLVPMPNGTEEIRWPPCRRRGLQQLRALPPRQQHHGFLGTTAAGGGSGLPEDWLVEPDLGSEGTLHLALVAAAPAEMALPDEQNFADSDVSKRRRPASARGGSGGGRLIAGVRLGSWAERTEQLRGELRRLHTSEVEPAARVRAARGAVAGPKAAASKARSRTSGGRPSSALRPVPPPSQLSVDAMLSYLHSSSMPGSGTKNVVDGALPPTDEEELSLRPSARQVVVQGGVVTSPPPPHSASAGRFSRLGPELRAEGIELRPAPKPYVRGQRPCSAPGAGRQRPRPPPPSARRLTASRMKSGSLVSSGGGFGGQQLQRATFRATIRSTISSYRAWQDEEDDEEEKEERKGHGNFAWLSPGWLSSHRNSFEGRACPCGPPDPEQIARGQGWLPVRLARTGKLQWDQCVLPPRLRPERFQDDRFSVC